MEFLFKGLILGAAVVVAAVTVAVEMWQYRNVPRAYAAHGERRRRDD